MRHFSNIHNLPSPFFWAVINDTYKGGGDITTTSLNKPPRMLQLWKRHSDKIVTDISEMIWLLNGQAMHAILERGASDFHIAEERLKMKVNGWDISGQTDVYQEFDTEVVEEHGKYIERRKPRSTSNGILSDYKVTSVYSFLLGDKPDWDAQLNVNGMLYREAGFPVEELRITALLRDWMKSKAISSKYPQKNIHTVGFPVWSDAKIIEYVSERVELHRSAEGLKDEDLPLCTPEERWYRGEGYAVYKNGNKRADRVLDTLAEANEFIEDNAAAAAAMKPKRYFIEPQKREGINVRCLDYCAVRSICPFAKSLVQQSAEDAGEII